MPLRIGLNGTRLSGKSTQVQKLIAKYNINLIDPKAIIK
jgi:dephospho-CoA kinase